MQNLSYNVSIPVQASCVVHYVHSHVRAHTVLRCPSLNSCKLVKPDGGLPETGIAIVLLRRVMYTMAMEWSAEDL